MSSPDFTPKVGEPLDRNVVRQQDDGFLSVCHDTYCSWMGLFPDYELAHSALVSHVEHAKRSGEMHYGNINWSILELVDDATARFMDGDAPLPGGGPSQNEVDNNATWDRSTSDGETVDDLVYRGLHFDKNGYGEGVVVKCNARWACGLPTYNIIFVPPDAETQADGTYSKDNYKYLNQLVAQDGDVYCQYIDGGPAFEPLGPADGFQLGFGAVSVGGP